MKKSYDLLVNPYSRRDPIRLAIRIHKTHKQDFQRAVTTIGDAEWKLLKWAGAGRYHLWALAMPDPLRSLVSELSGNPDIASIPNEWLDGKNAEDVFIRTRQTLDTLSVSERNAAWTLLSAAQLRKATNVEAWWKPARLLGAA